MNSASARNASACSLLLVAAAGAFAQGVDFVQLPLGDHDLSGLNSPFQGSTIYILSLPDRLPFTLQSFRWNDTSFELQQHCSFSPPGPAGSFLRLEGWNDGAAVASWTDRGVCPLFPLLLALEPLGTATFDELRFQVNWLDFFSVADFEVTVVPDPATYALMLGGLGVLAFLSSRRSTARKTASMSSPHGAG